MMVQDILVVLVQEQVIVLMISLWLLMTRRLDTNGEVWFGKNGTWQEEK